MAQRGKAVTLEVLVGHPFGCAPSKATIYLPAIQHIEETDQVPEKWGWDCGSWVHMNGYGLFANISYHDLLIKWRDALDIIHQ